MVSKKTKYDFIEMLKSWQSILLSRPLNSYYNEIKVQTSAFMSHKRFNYFVVQIEDKFID